MTVVEGVVPGDREDAFRAAWERVTEGAIPPGFVRTTLLRNGDAWRIGTVWESRAALDSMRASVGTPPAITVFQAAGVEPSVSIWEVEGGLAAPPTR